MNIYPVILFPYSGYKQDSPREKMFWDIVECCQRVSSAKPPIVVLNRDTERHNNDQREHSYRKLRL